MPILTTEEISRKELEKIINFGKENKLITKKQATDLTNSLYKNISLLLFEQHPTIANMSEQNKIDLNDVELKLLIMMQEKRIQSSRKGMSYKCSLSLLGLVLFSFLVVFFFLAIVTGGAPFALGSLALVGPTAASCYGLLSELYGPTLEETLATLKKSEVSTNHSTPTPQTSPNENSSKNQPASEKIQHSRPLNFFPTGSTRQDVDSFSKLENTPQYKN